MTGDWMMNGFGEGREKIEGDGRRRPDGDEVVGGVPPPLPGTPARCVMLVLTGGVLPMLVCMLTLAAVLVASDVLMLMLPTCVVAVLTTPPPALGLALAPGGPGGPDGPGGPGGPVGAGGGRTMDGEGSAGTIGGGGAGDGGNGPKEMGEGNGPVLTTPVPWSMAVVAGQG